MNTSKSIRLSKWVHLFCGNSQVIALYHSLNIDVMYLPQQFGPMLDLLRVGTTSDFLAQQNFNEGVDMPSIVTALQERRFVVSINEDDSVLLEEKREMVMQSQGLETLYLLLSDHCNLRCSYCFIHGSMPEVYKRKTMDWKTAQTAVDMFFANVAKNPSETKRNRKTILFYGGEPLLNFDLLRKVVLYVEDVYRNELTEMGKGFIFSLITNGTLIDETVAVFMAEHSRISITVSLDGPKVINDQKRSFIDGRGTYEQAVQGLRILQRAGCHSTSLSCTVDEHNVDRLEEVLALSDEFGLLAINLNPLLDTEQEKVNDAYITKVNSRMIEYFLLARQKGVYEERMMRKIRPFISHRVRPYDCQATGSQIVCSPDGQLGVCQEGLGMKNYFFGKVSREFEFHRHSVTREWSQRSPLNMPQCYDCPAIGTCGGGCAYGAHLRNGSIWSIDTRFCKHSLVTLEWIIWDVYDQMIATQN